jgi:hypothetical protein
LYLHWLALGTSWVGTGLASIMYALIYKIKTDNTLK